MDVTISSLWLPILLGGVAVWFASFVLRMVLKHHDNDFASLPDEDAIRQAFQSSKVEGGRQYSIPHCGDMKGMQDPEWQKRWAEGPAGMVFLFPAGPYKFGSALVMSLLFNILAAFMAAYLATQALPAGAPGMDVLQFVSVVGFLTFGGAAIWGPIWMAQSWSMCLKALIDSLVYGLAMGGVFMAFWPAAAAAVGG